MIEPYVHPLPIKANDDRLMVRGQPIPVDCRIISEDNYQRLLNVLALADEVIIELAGNWPIDGRPPRPECLAVRAITGHEYLERKRRANEARKDLPK